MLYAISDIHGHLDALKEALEHIDLSGDSRLVLLGDYIDFGPQSGETLRYIYELQQRSPKNKVTVLRGNHEEAFLEWLDAYGGPRKPDQYGILPWSDWLDFDKDLGTFRTLVSPEQLSRLEQADLSGDPWNIKAAQLVLDHNRELIPWLKELPWFHETERQIFVHAGVDEEAGDWWPWSTQEYVFIGKFPPSTGAFYKDIIAGHAGTSALSGDAAYHGVFWDGQSHYYIDGSIQQGGRLNILSWDEGHGYRQWDGEWKPV